MQIVAEPRLYKGRPERLAALREGLGLTLREVEEKLRQGGEGVSYSRIHEYELNPAVKIKPKVLERLAEIYKVSVAYIQAGTISPTEPINPMPPKIIYVSDNDKQERIPIVDIPAAAGYMKHYAESDYLRQLPTTFLPGFMNGSYRIFQVKGNSMEPLIREGDYLVTAYVEALTDMVPGRIYVIVSTEGICVKYANYNVRRHGLLIESENKEYTPDFIPIEEVREVWEYRAKLTTHLN